MPRFASLLGLLLLAACAQKPANDQTEWMNSPDSAGAVPPPPPVLPGALGPTPAKTRFQALGTEPFWSVEVGGGTLRYTTPEDMKGTALPALEQALGEGWRYEASLTGKRIVLVIEPGQCSDGMSDTVYPYKATFALGEAALRGCARRR